MTSEPLTSRVYVRFDRGGRKAPPRERYMAPARRVGDDEAMWTLVLEFDRPLSPDCWETAAKADFLVDDAPHELLTSGTTLEILEGHRVVATVQVVSSSAKIPESDIVDTGVGAPKPRQAA